MNTKNLILVTLLSISTFAFSQRKPKIKGNKNVVEIFNSLGAFNSIEIEDNLTVNIIQDDHVEYYLKTDENLVNAIKFDIIDGTLKIYSTHNIKKSKDLEIKLTFKTIDKIILKDDAKLISKNKLIFESLSFISKDHTSYDLDLKVRDGVFNVSKKSSGKITLRGDNAKMVLNEKAYLKGKIALDYMDITMNDHSDIDITGDVKNLKMEASDYSKIKAKKLKTTFADLNSSSSSDVYLYASKELKLYAKGKSNIYVYGNPEIKVNGLNDKSKIIKK